MTDSTESFERVARWLAPGGRLLRAWQLTGGVSAQVTALAIARADGTPWTVVVRQHGQRDLQADPAIATHEFALLRLLQASGVPVPTPIAVDESGAIFATPYLVVEYIAGQPESAPIGDALATQLATHLARIHQVECALAFLPPPERRYRPLLHQSPTDEPPRTKLLRALLATTWPPLQHNRSVLLHGDFWPGNIIWRNGQLTAIIDWEDAACGDPLADIANTRLELLWADGEATMEVFTTQYGAYNPIDMTNLPAWDLCVALRAAANLAGWGLAPLVETEMRQRLDRFTDAALRLQFEC